MSLRTFTIYRFICDVCQVYAECEHTQEVKLPGGMLEVKKDGNVNHFCSVAHMVRYYTEGR